MFGVTGSTIGSSPYRQKFQFLLTNLTKNASRRHLQKQVNPLHGGGGHETRPPDSTGPNNRRRRPTDVRRTSVGRPLDVRRTSDARQSDVPGLRQSRSIFCSYEGGAQRQLGIEPASEPSPEPVPSPQPTASHLKLDDPDSDDYVTAIARQIAAARLLLVCLLTATSSE